MAATSKKSTAPAVQTTEVATADLTAGKVLSLVRSGGKIRLKEEDGEQMAFAIMSDRLSADSAEGLFAGGSDGTLKLADLGPEPFRLESVSFRNSDFDEEGSVGIYAVMTITRKGGGTEVLIAGSTDIVLRCLAAVEREYLPRWLRITSDRTKAGYTVYNLVDAPSQSDAQLDF